MNMEHEYPCFECGHAGINQETGECPLHGYWEECWACGTSYEFTDAYADAGGIPVCPACGWMEEFGYVETLHGAAIAA